jgi:CO/xanthine dehydrogenase FAD-binding subunit
MRSSVSEYDLVVAKTLTDALAIVGNGSHWRPIAGGTDLMVLFNAGRLPYRGLVSNGQGEELRGIEVRNNDISIGASVTYTEIRNHSVLISEFPLLCQAASWTGGVATQNRGTIGGNIANASPAADSCPMLLAYDAELELVSTCGRRRVSYASFHKEYKQMQLRPDELITSIILPRKERVVQYARKVGTRKAQAIAKVLFALTANRDGNALRDVRIALGSVAPIPLRCVETEKVLEKGEVTPALVKIAKETIAREIRPISDVRSTDEYRSKVTLNLLGAVLESVG